MRGFGIIAIVVAASLLPSTVVRADDAAEAVEPKAKDRMVCKRVQRTGTRFYDKTCKTAAQWDAIAEQHRRDAAEMINRPQVEIRRE